MAKTTVGKIILDQFERVPGSTVFWTGELSGRPVLAYKRRSVNSYRFYAYADEAELQADLDENKHKHFFKLDRGQQMTEQNGNFELPIDQEMPILMVEGESIVPEHQKIKLTLKDKKLLKEAEQKKAEEPLASPAPQVKKEESSSEEEEGSSTEDTRRMIDDELDEAIVTEPGEKPKSYTEEEIQQQLAEKKRLFRLETSSYEPLTLTTQMLMLNPDGGISAEDIGEIIDQKGQINKLLSEGKTTEAKDEVKKLVNKLYRLKKQQRPKIATASDIVTSLRQLKVPVQAEEVK
jgi:hypothetical protein